MRRLILHVALALLTLTTGIFATRGWNFLGQRFAPEATTSQAEKEMLEIERQYDIAQTQIDIAFFEKIEADDFKLITKDGATFTKAQTIAPMKNWKRETQFTSDDLHVEVYGNTALVTGRMTATKIGEGNKGRMQLRWLDIFVKRNGRWQLLNTVQLER